MGQALAESPCWAAGRPNRCAQKQISSAQNGKGVYWVSSLKSWLGVARQVWGPFPQHQQGGIRKLMQMLDGSQPRFSGWRIFTHSTVSWAPGQAQPEAGGLHPRKVRSPFHLYLQSIQRLLRGSSFRQGLAFAGSVSVSVSRAATQPSALATCLRATRVRAPPRTPWHLGYPAARLMDASTECASAGCSAP